jgi:hypothetical protein
MGMDAQIEDRTTTLGPSETDVARTAVFAWALLPAAGRLTREATAGHDLRQAIRELRAAIRLLDVLGWPGDGPAPAELSAGEAEVVRHAARVQLGHGLDPEGRGFARVTRGPAGVTPAGHGSMRRLLEQLERGDC